MDEQIQLLIRLNYLARFWRWDVNHVRVFLSLEAAAFGAAALVHAGVLATGYEHREASVAEGVIAVVLVLGLVAGVFAPLWRRADGPLAVVASVLCFSTLPEGYSLGLTTTVVGVPIVLVVTVLLVRQGWRTARRVDWRNLPHLSAPLLPRRSETPGQVRVR